MKKHLLVALLAILPFCAYSQTNNEGYRLEFEDAFIFGIDTLVDNTNSPFKKSFKIPDNMVLKIVSGFGSNLYWQMSIDGGPSIPFGANPSMESPLWLPGGKTVTLIATISGSQISAECRLSGILYRKVPN